MVHQSEHQRYGSAGMRDVVGKVKETRSSAKVSGKRVERTRWKFHKYVKIHPARVLWEDFLQGSRTFHQQVGLRGIELIDSRSKIAGGRERYLCF
jgi:hypothetical protein